MNKHAILMLLAVLGALAQLSFAAASADGGNGLSTDSLDDGAQDYTDSLLGDGAPEDDDEPSVILLTSSECVCDPDDSDCSCDDESVANEGDSDEECECEEDDADCSCEEELSGWDAFTTNYLSVMDISILVALVAMAVALTASAVKVFLIYRQGPTDHGLGLGDDDLEHSEIALDDVSANMFEIGEIDNEEDDVL